MGVGINGRFSIANDPASKTENKIRDITRRSRFVPVVHDRLEVSPESYDEIRFARVATLVRRAAKTAISRVKTEVAK